MEIPGYYFDESKKKYFKITHNTPASSKYSKSAIKQEKNELERSKKRAKVEKLASNRVPFVLSEGLNISSKISAVNLNNERLNIQEFMIKKLNLEGSMKTRGRLNSDVLKKIAYEGINERFILSSLNNIYEMPSYSMEFDKSQELFPMLKLHRIDKTTSILRSLLLIPDCSEKPIIRTWFGGSYKEPSEVELSIQDANCNFITKSRIRSSRNESFNNSIYNRHRDHIIVCGNKGVSKFNSEDLSKSSREIVFQGADVLSMDIRDNNIYVLGLRNGQAMIVDDRLDYKKSYQNSKSRGENSIINIKSLTGNRVLCSFLGSKLKLFDIRMGFKNCFVDYCTAKNVENVFGETLEMEDDILIRIQNQSICEFFNPSNSMPLKTLKFCSNQQVSDGCFNSESEGYQLLTTDGENISFYS